MKNVNNAHNIEVLLEIKTEKKLSLTTILIHLLQKQLTRIELIELTAYLLVVRFRKVKDLKKLFQGPHDFLYLLVSANLIQLNFPFNQSAWQAFFEKAQMAQAIDPTAKQNLSRFETTQALLDKIAHDPLSAATQAQINEAQQFSVALSHILVNIKAAQAQTNKPFQDIQDEVVTLLLPLYHEYQNTTEPHPKLTLKFLINFLDFSIQVLKNPEQEKTIRNLLKRGNPLQSLASALTEHNKMYEPIPVATQLKKTLWQTYQESDDLYKKQVRPVQQRTAKCRFLLLNLAEHFPKNSDTYLKLKNQANVLLTARKKLEQAIGTADFSLPLLSTYAGIARNQIDACMSPMVNQAIDSKMPVHWFLLTASKEPRVQEKCINILLQEGADPRFEITAYPRTLKQKWQDSRDNLKQSQWLRAIESLWMTPLRSATALAELLGQKDIAGLLMAQTIRLSGQELKPLERLSNIIELDITKGFLPAFAASFKPEDSDILVPEAAPQRKIVMP